MIMLEVEEGQKRVRSMVVEKEGTNRDICLGHP